MAVKGTESKQNITKELLTYFGNRAFLYNDGKEIRVECVEAGERVQIKIALTAAKVAVEKDGDNAMPGIAATAPQSSQTSEFTVQPEPVGAAIPPTAEEKVTISQLLSKLGL